MTIGTKVADLRVWHPPEQYGAFLTGLYSYKNWSGVDTPPTPWKQYGFIPVWKKQGLVYRKTQLWARPPKRVRLAEHPYQCTWERFSNPRVGLRWSNAEAWNYGGFRELFSPGIFPGRWVALDDLELIGRLRTKIAGSSFNAAVSLAELPQTLEFIAGSARRINTALGAVKKKQYRQAVNILSGGRQGQKPDPTVAKLLATSGKRSANGVLAFNYAVVPALLDVKEAAEALAHWLNFPLQETFRVTRLRRYPGPAGIDGAIRPLRQWCLLRKSIIARVREVNIPQLMGLTDPLSVVWEKTVLSFVADWFIPVGNWLDARGLAQALEGTYVTSLKEEFGWVGAVSNSPPFQLTGASAWSYSTGVFSRTVTDHLAVPKLNFKPLSDIPTWRKATNAIALLVTNHGSKR